MPFHSMVLFQAEQAYQMQKQSRQRQQKALETQLYEKDQELARLDRKLRDTMALLFGSVLREPGAPSLESLRAENLSLQAQRAQRIQALGHTLEEVDQAALCPICQDSGWLGQQMCRCFLPFCVQAQLEQLSQLVDVWKQNFSNYNPDLYSREIWAGQDVSPRENMELNFDVCFTYAQKFGQTRLRNLLLTGSPGLGKTFLSACIARQVTELGFSVAYDTATQVAYYFDQRKFGRKNQEEHEKALEETARYLHCDLLILDDLGSEYTTEPVQSALYELINTRLIQQKQTAISTNLSIDEIKLRYPPQVASRFEGDFTILHFYGDDIRKIQQEGR